MPKKAVKPAPKTTRRKAAPVMAEPVYTPEVMPKSSYSFSSFVEFLNANFSVILIVGIFFILGFLGGSLWTENQLGKKAGLGAGNQLGANAPTEDQGPSEETLKQVPKVTKEDHVRGDVNKAKIVLIEYSDYECPFCNRFHPTMQKVMETYGDKVAWVYRHFPLAFHPKAEPVAQMAECVAKTGGNDAFWKFSDSVYESVANQGTTALEDASLEKLVAQAGVSVDKVKTCVASGEMKQKVKDQADGGSTAGVGGTPGTIIVAGDKYALIPGALPFDQVKAQIDGLLK